MALGQVKVPDIGDFKDVAVIELLVKPGDTIAVDQSLLTVESDKASMEIPSTHAGVVKELRSRWATRSAQARWCWWWRRPAAAAAPVSRCRRRPRPRLHRCAAAARAAARGCGRRRDRPDRDACVPDIGDFDEVAVIEVFVKPGDTSRSSRA
jgi:pyruvate dehydrogenase E2 component (dihydrolipoamide acetyltransferase)